MQIAEEINFTKWTMQISEEKQTKQQTIRIIAWLIVERGPATTLKYRLICRSKAFNNIDRSRMGMSISRLCVQYTTTIVQQLAAGPTP